MVKLGWIENRNARAALFTGYFPGGDFLRALHPLPAKEIERAHRKKRGRRQDNEIAHSLIPCFP